MNSLDIKSDIPFLTKGRPVPQSQVALLFPTRLRTLFGELAETADIIRWFGDPILRKMCKEITTKEFRQSVDVISMKMIDVLSNIRKRLGIGRAIAAPQIGISKRIITVLRDAGGELRPHIYINPKIISFSQEKAVYKEICLSGLPLAADVVRPYEVTVEYLESDGSIRQIQPDPMLARILQHEIDHLNGILFLDKADPKSIQFIQNFDEYNANATLSKIK